MVLLRRTAHGILEMNRAGSLVRHLATQFSFTYGYQPGGSEQQSWAASLPVLAQDLVDAELGDVEMLVEYQLPLTSLRADVVLAGRHPVTHAVSYVVVELKQWTSAGIVDGDPELCVPAGPPGRVISRKDVRRDRVAEEIASALQERGHETALHFGLSHFTVDLAVRRAGAERWSVPVLLDGQAWARRPTVADRDAAPQLLDKLMSWPAVCPGLVATVDQRPGHRAFPHRRPADRNLGAGPCTDGRRRRIR